MTDLPTPLDPHGRLPGPRPGTRMCSRVQVTLDASTDLSALASRYLSPAEQPVFESRSPRGHVPWLLGRVAAKDAVRRHLAVRGFAELDPTRIVVLNDDNGCPLVQVRGARLAARGVRVSIAHKPTVAVALATTLPSTRPAGAPRHEPPPSIGIGIDIEAVEARSPTFERTALTPAERALEPVPAERRDAWLTRIWAAKEATAKATGLGLGGRPKDFEVDAVLDDRVRCRGRWVTTEPLHTADGDFVVAWTDLS